MTDGGHIAQEDLALYAMRGCSDGEAAAVRSHVKECAACRGELEKVTRDLAVVAMSVEQHPLPDGARQRFMEKITITPPAKELLAHPPVIAIRSTQPERGKTVWMPWALAAVMALVAFLLGVKVFSLKEELRSESHQLGILILENAHAQQVLEVLTAPNAQHVVLTAGKTASVPTARVVYLASRGGLIFQASNMGPLPEDKTYELWVIPADGKAPIPAGLFRPDATGSASVLLPRIPQGVEAKAFGVTIERAEGSETPTLPIILAGAAATS